MTLKKFVSYSLFVFVTASIVVLTVNAFREKPAGEGIPVADGVVAYYLHTKTRCPDCIAMEECAHRAVHEGFPEQLEEGTLVWRVADQSEPSMEALGNVCGGIASVVLVRVETLKLQDIRQRGDSHDEYTAYIQSEIEKYLNAGENEPAEEQSNPTEGGDQVPGEQVMPLPGETVPLPGETVPLPGVSPPLPGQ